MSSCSGGGRARGSRECFSTSDGVGLHYRRIGTGAPLICVPGGPLLPADYLGDLGGLDRTAELILVDPRGSDRSARVDPLMCRCGAIAQDLEALRLHLGVQRLDLLGHSAGANIVVRYAELHPGRVGRLVLVAPSTRAVGIEIGDNARTAVARSRAGEPWYPDAADALRRIQGGDASESDWAAITPFTHGRWDDEARAFEARMDLQRNPEAAMAFGAEGSFDPPATTAVISTIEVPVTVLAGSADVGNPVDAMGELAALFPQGRLIVQDGAGHYPWMDDPAAFRALIAPELAGASRGAD